MKKQLEEGFKKIFRSTPEKYFSCGGRFEILGNHTDHNHGKCLAGTCSLSNYAAVKVRNDTKISIYSKGYGPFKLDVSNTKYKEEENGLNIKFIISSHHLITFLDVVNIRYSRYFRSLSGFICISSS